MKIYALALGFVIICTHNAPAIARTSQKDAKQETPTSTPNGVSAAAAAATSSQDAAPTETKIDPGKEAAIRKLIALSGGMNLANQMMDGMQKTLRPMLSNSFPPGDYRDKLIDLFFENFRAKANSQFMEDITVRAYDKYFTVDDLNGRIQFYSTPLGQKTIQVMPKLMTELQSEGAKRGQDLGRQSMQEVLQQHPELLQEMEEARKNARQPQQSSPQPSPQP